ncbi:MAG: DUF2934 domain-containing protein [Candidatus Omnitrophica bacterium]|nr:DUF2934 domain-containing protein [Candidatus Omnitrophota bacterium]
MAKTTKTTKTTKATKTTKTTKSSSSKRSSASSKMSSDKLKQLNCTDFCSMVGQRAYYYFESRGYQHGNDLGDWYRAEQELKKQYKVK